MKITIKNITLISMALFICLTTGCSSKKTNVKLFSTNYDIEDYCENSIIVSKSDGKVYGLLDNNGKEVLPLNYDDLDFINKSDYINGVVDTLYIRSEYEGKYSVLDSKGNEIFESEKSISYFDCSLKSTMNDNSPLFKSSGGQGQGQGYVLYDSTGKEISKVPCDILHLVYFISANCYMDYDATNLDLKILKLNGEIIKEYKKVNLLQNSVILNNQYIAFASDENNGVLEIHISENGNIEKEQHLSSYSEFQDEYKKLKDEEKENKDIANQFRIYQTNGTWKIEDIEGNPLYEERYFERLSPSGENECIALTNEDNQLCIIGHQGTKYVDFGMLEYDEDDEEVFMVIKDEKFEVEEIFEGKNSIIIPVKDKEGKDIYYFSAK